jgi:type I restriction enzyme, R subunit
VSPRDYSEDELVERPTMELLGTIGYKIADGYTETLGPDGLGRDAQSEVILRHRLAPKLAELNPDLPPVAIAAAVDTLMLDRSTLDPTRADRAVQALLRDGVKVTYADEHGERVTEPSR